MPLGRFPTVILMTLMLVHSALLAEQGLRNAPNLNESAHLASGYSHWKFWNFTLYRVNPPLIRMWAALPLLITRPKTDWTQFSDTPFSRAEFSIGSAFHEANGMQAFWYCTLARWAVVPVSLLGMWVCYRWSTELFGRSAGIVVAVLWCFCPSLLAWGASITPDMGSATFGILAAWRFWKWLQRPSWRNAAIAGITLGLAELTKTTWVILFGLWPLLWGVWRFAPGLSGAAVPPFRQLCCIPALALYLLNLGYVFEETGLPLKDFTFISETLGGDGAHDQGGNRFQDTWLGRIPVPVPANWLRGIDVQKYDFERGKPSYLRGEHKKGGWWYYYLYAFAVKTPVGFLAMTALAACLFTVRRKYRAGWRNEMLIIVPGLAVFVLVSSQTGFNRYLRYVLPAFPFVYIFASRAAIAFRERSRLLSVTVAGLLGAGVVSSLSVFPYSMSYFNYAVGGPEGGRYHLLDGNIDWGQDLLRLKAWLDDHPDVKPLYTVLTTFVPLKSAGIESEGFPVSDESDGEEGARRLPPGWYAISVNHLMGYRLFGAISAHIVPFQQMEPVARIGYSIFIYHIGETEGDGFETGGSAEPDGKAVSAADETVPP